MDILSDICNRAENILRNTTTTIEAIKNSKEQDPLEILNTILELATNIKKENLKIIEIVENKKIEEFSFNNSKTSSKFVVLESKSHQSFKIYSDQNSPMKSPKNSQKKFMKQKNFEVIEIGRKGDRYQPVLDFVVNGSELRMEEEYLKGETLKQKSQESEFFNVSTRKKNSRILENKIAFLENFIEDLASKLENKKCQYEAKTLALADIADQLNYQVRKNRILEEKMNNISKNLKKIEKVKNYVKKKENKEPVVIKEEMRDEVIFTFDQDKEKTMKFEYHKETHQRVLNEQRLHQNSIQNKSTSKEKIENLHTPENSEKSQNSKKIKKTPSKRTQAVEKKPPKSKTISFDSKLELGYKKLRTMPSLPPKITKLLSSLPVISYPTKSNFYNRSAPFLGPFDFGNICGKGQMKDGHMHGKGVNLWYSDKKFCYYVGEFKRGMRHGFGRMVYRNGKVSEGYWDNGVFIGENIVEN